MKKVNEPIRFKLFYEAHLTVWYLLATMFWELHHGGGITNRMDKRDVESNYRLHARFGRLRQLLRRPHVAPSRADRLR